MSALFEEFLAIGQLYNVYGATFGIIEQHKRLLNIVDNSLGKGPNDDYLYILQSILFSSITYFNHDQFSVADITSYFVTLRNIASELNKHSTIQFILQNQIQMKEITEKKSKTLMILSTTKLFQS